jgi:hypothetical protein
MLDSHGRVLSECPQDKRKNYPVSPDCCGAPQGLYFAKTIYDGERLVAIGGYMLRCAVCHSEMEVDLVTTMIAGHWVREVL